MKYKFVYYDEKYHIRKFNAKNDYEAVEKSQKIDINLGMCFDLFRDNEKIPFFNDELLNGYVHWYIDEY